MSETKTFDWQLFKNDWREVRLFLLQFAKDPVKSVRELPDWNWKTLAVFHGSIAGISGLLSGIVAGSFSKMILGAIFIPFTSLIINLVSAGFFYYFFMFFLAREINFKQLLTLFILANLPMMALYTITPILPPATLLGLAATGVLLIVGLVDFFLLPKKPVMQLIIAIYSVYCLMWVFSLIHEKINETPRHQQASPESLDILEKEMQGQ